MSAVFYHNEEQKRLAEETLKQAQKSVARPIQTQILQASTFYEAEEYANRSNTFFLNREKYIHLLLFISYHQKYLLQQHPWLLNQLDIEPGPELNNSYVATRLNGYIGGYGTMANFEAELPSLRLDDKLADYVRRAMKSGSRINC